jgi:hypothetical protein
MGRLASAGETADASFSVIGMWLGALEGFTSFGVSGALPPTIPDVSE